MKLTQSRVISPESYRAKSKESNRESKDKCL